jgi:hypothetical protein
MHGSANSGIFTETSIFEIPCSIFDIRFLFHLNPQPLESLNPFNITIQAGQRDRAIWHFWDGFLGQAIEVVSTCGTV